MSTPTTTPSTSPTTTEAPSGLSSSKGATTVAETVVSKIAGMAAREVHGVYALGGGAARAFGALRERIPGAVSNVSQGVSVEVGERQAAVDLDLVVEYGVAIVELARSVRRNVTTALEQMTGLEIVEVNVTVNDVHIAGEEDTRPAAPPAPPRVA